jgi:hypothetical protein
VLIEIALIVSCLVAVAGWALWFLCRIERRAALADNEALNARVMLAEGKASAVRHQESAATDLVRNSQAQARIAHVEMASLRGTLRESLADRDRLEARIRQLEVEADKEAMLRRSEEKLRLYSPRAAVPKREDG